LAEYEVATPASRTVLAVSPGPSDRDPITDLPRLHGVANRLDDTGDLVSRRDGIRDSRPTPGDEFCIGTTDTAGLHGDTHLLRARVTLFFNSHLERVAR
jgi:hypothetical protein